jgi:putative transposase
MRKGRFTDDEMVKILREAERSSVAEVARKYAVSEQTLYVWRKRFGAMSVDEAKRLKALEAENTRLKKLLAESQLANEILKEVAAKKW